MREKYYILSLRDRLQQIRDRLGAESAEHLAAESVQQREATLQQINDTQRERMAGETIKETSSIGTYQ